MGYRNEAPRKDYSEHTTKDEGCMSTWKLDDVHLTLNEKILESEKPVKPFRTFWTDTATFNTYDDAKRADPANPYDYNYAFCNDH